MRIEKEKITITKEIMRIDTRRQTIDMRQINNRRFLYNPKTAVLVLGRQYGKTKGLPASHAEELAGAGITKDFDDFVRGWIGTSRSYPEGIIHFAPCVDERNIKLFERGLGNRWEQPLSAIFTDLQRREQKISVKEQLKKQSEAKAVRHKKENQQER